MKNFVKKLALFLALAMVITTVTPTTINISAASKITLKSGAAAPASVYAGHNYTLKVAGTTVKFYSSDKSIATIGMTTGKFKPVAPGTVKITAKSKKTGKTVATKSFKVLQRATAVTTETTELYLGAVDDTATLQAVKTPATSTDVVKFFATDKTIATVGMTSGKVTAKAEGTTTVSVYAMATKATSKSSKYNKVATVNVYVGPYMESAVQTSVTTVDLTFKSDLKAVKATDFTVTNDATKITYPIKDVEISSTDAKVVTITTYAELKDGGTYTVSYAKTSAQFKATEGTVTSIEIDPTAIVVRKEATIYVVAKDANGVVLGRYDSTNLPTNYELSVTTSDGYTTSKGGLYLNTLTSTAKASAKYHSTWKYENGKEVGVIETGDVTITATEIDSITSSGIIWTISNTTPKFTSSTYKQNTDICVGDTGYKAYFKILDSNNREISNYENYKVESSNNEILIVTSALGGVLGAEKAVALVGLTAGTAYLVIRNSATNVVVATLPVTVKAQRQATSFSLSNSSVTLSNSSKMADQAVITTVTVLDQYGEKMRLEEKPSVVLKDSPSGYEESLAGKLTAVDATDSSNKTLKTRCNQDAPKGTYRYEIGYKNLPVQTFYVIVQSPNSLGRVGFIVTQSADAIDAVVTSSEDLNKSIEFTPVLTKDGIASETLALASNGMDPVTTGGYGRIDVVVAATNSNGASVKDLYMDGTTFYAVKTNGGNVVVTPADTYTVKFTISAWRQDQSVVSTVVTKTIKVTNSQPAVTYKRQADKFGRSFILSDGVLDDLAAVLNKCYTFTYDGTTYGYGGTALQSDDVSAIYRHCSDSMVAFNSITLQIPVADGVKLPVKITMDTDFTISI